MTSNLLPELAAIDLAGRDTMIIYDTDAVEKVGVQEAERRLARCLCRAGARPRLVRLPAIAGAKVALDDYLIKHCASELRQLCYAMPVWQAYEPPIFLEDLMAKDCPPIEWVWDSLLLKGEVNLLYGDGGTGKSLLSLHIAMHVAAGRPLFGRAVIQMPVLAMLTEDGEAEVKARLQTIRRVHQLPLTPLPLRLWCQPREDTLLADIDDRGRVKELDRLDTIRAELIAIGEPTLVILDGMADLFAIDETSRLPVTAAIKRVLGSLCRDHGATVLVLAHPSKAAMQDGSHYSGSTAFNNAVRQRITLEIVKDTQTGGIPPRRLSVAKSNYGGQAEVTLWLDGRAMVEMPPGATLSETDLESAILQTMLRVIDRGGRVVHRNGNAGEARTLSDFTKSVNEQHGLSLRWKVVADHLRRLVDKGVLGYRQSDTSKRPHIKASYVRGQRSQN